MDSIYHHKVRTLFKRDVSKKADNYEVSAS